MKDNNQICLTIGQIPFTKELQDETKEPKTTGHIK